MRRISTHRTALLVGAALALTILPTSASSQDRELQNIQFFPPDITRDSLVQVMRTFSFALGVRCQYCHTGGDGISFEGVSFESDADPDKRKARFMLRMVETLNQSVLPLMADRDAPGYEVTCKTCHRGQPKPVLLTEIIRSVLDEHGADSAAVHYRTLREQAGLAGSFDFGEWEMNVLAERLTREGRLDDAIAVYEINFESFPASQAIASSLAGLHERVGNMESAIHYYERVLKLAPGDSAAQERLDALRGR